MADEGRLDRQEADQQWQKKTDGALFRAPFFYRKCVTLRSRMVARARNACGTQTTSEQLNLARLRWNIKVT